MMIFPCILRPCKQLLFNGVGMRKNALLRNLMLMYFVRDQTLVGVNGGFYIDLPDAIKGEITKDFQKHACRILSIRKLSVFINKHMLVNHVL